MIFPSPPRKAGPRDLLYFRTPQLWRHWPYLPLVRHKPDDEVECGVMYDFRGRSGRFGYSATVFLAILFFMPATEDEILALPKEVFDSPEEIAAAGWIVD